MRPCSNPAICTSAPYRARPVTLSTPSWRMGRVPITEYCFLLLMRKDTPTDTQAHRLRPVGCFPTGRSPWAWRAGCSGARLCCIEPRANDLVIPRATAQVAGEPVAHLLLGGPGIAIQQGLGSHDETRRADPALQSRLFEKLLLQR